MNRRKVISSIAASSLVAISGCMKTLDSSIPSDENSTAKLGESVTHDGLKVAVIDYSTTDIVRIPISFGKTRTVEPPENALFLLVKISVTNVGENKRSFPTLDTGPYESETSQIRAFLNGERLDGKYFGAPDGKLKFNDEMHTAYNWVVSEAGGISGAYPETKAEGWAPFIIGAAVDPTSVSLEVEWRDKTYRWAFSN